MSIFGVVDTIVVITVGADASFFSEFKTINMITEPVIMTIGWTILAPPRSSRSYARSYARSYEIEKSHHAVTHAVIK